MVLARAAPFSLHAPIKHPVLSFTLPSVAPSGSHCQCQAQTYCFWKLHLTMSLSELKFFCGARSWLDTEEAILDFIHTCPSSYYLYTLCCPDAVWLSHQASVHAALLTTTLLSYFSLQGSSQDSSILSQYLYSLLNTVVVPQSYNSITRNQTLDCTFLIGNKTILFSFIQAHSRPD